jgi:hypothetical protein
MAVGNFYFIRAVYAHELQVQPSSKSEQKSSDYCEVLYKFSASNDHFRAGRFASYVSLHRSIFLVLRTMLPLLCGRLCPP